LPLMTSCALINSTTKSVDMKPSNIPLALAYVVYRT
jgi:hypothetical protein